MKPTGLKCYRQVADVIGGAYADHELQRVLDCEHYEYNKECQLGFIWEDTPQGGNFWFLVHRGETPYENGHPKPELSEKGHTISDKERSDGSTASYYELPEGATELQHLISHRNQNGQIAEIFRACYRYGLVSHSDMLRDAKKIKFYAEAEIERLEKLSK